MLRHYSLMLFVILLLAVPTKQLAAQSSIKKVTIIITDANTGKPVEGAEIAFKALIGKYKKKTNAEGKALFDMFMIGKAMNMNYTVSYPNTSKKYKAYTGSIALVDNKDAYEFTAPVQPDARMVSFKIADDKRQALANAAVKLKDDNGNESASTTDANGVAAFDILPNAQYKNATLTVAKEGFNNYSVPVEINDQTSQVSIVAPLAAKAIIMDGFTEPIKEKKELPGPTNNVSFGSLPPGYSVAPKYPNPSWGPYKPDCNSNPLSAVPIFTPLSVEDEKTLLDNISSSCIGAAADAVNALVDVTENIANVGSKLNAIWAQAFQDKEIKKLVQGPQKAMDDTKKLVEEEREKTKKAITDAIEKAKELFGKMKELAEGPEMYALSCIWDGMKDYAVPEPLAKLKKSTEAFTKAKTAMEGKLDAIKKRLATGEMPKYSDKELFTDWKEVTEEVEKTTTGMNLIFSYINNPKKILPYETQVNLAISSAEKMIGTLMSDCQIRELDRQLKQGINAGQAALAAARKYAAQMKKGESKWRQIINDYVFKNFKSEDRGWEHFASNDYRIMMLPQGAYGSWVNYHNDAITAEKEAIRLEEPLNKLAGFCKRIQPMAATLNERVNKYEGLYTKGLIALEACKVSEARSYVEQLQSLEKSECGHFYPRPYDKTKSEELEAKIKASIKSGKCKEAGIDPKFAGKWYRCDKGYTITISGDAGGASMTWEQDLAYWEKPDWWRVKDGRIISNVKIEGNKISGRMESSPDYETYLIDSDLGRKKGKIMASFEFTIKQFNYGPDSDRIILEGSAVYDGDYCKGCTETWCFIRVKKW